MTPDEKKAVKAYRKRAAEAGIEIEGPDYQRSEARIKATAMKRREHKAAPPPGRQR